MLRHFIPMLDQCENLALIEHCWLRKEPLSQRQFEFVIRVKLLTAEELFRGSKQIKIWGFQFQAICWVLQNFPTISLHFCTNWAIHMRMSLVMQLSKVLISRTVLVPNCMLLFSQNLQYFHGTGTAPVANLYVLEENEHQFPSGKWNFGYLSDRRRWMFPHYAPSFWLRCN